MQLLLSLFEVEERNADIEVQLSGGYLGYDQQILHYWITLFCQRLSDPVNDRMTDDRENHDHDQTSNNGRDPVDRGCHGNSFQDQTTDGRNFQNQLMEVNAAGLQVSR